MTMAAVSGDAARLAQCGMLRASPNANGCRCQASVCDILPGRLPWSLMLPVGGWPTTYKTQLLAYHLRKKTIVIFCDME